MEKSIIILILAATFLVSAAMAMPQKIPSTDEPSSRPSYAHKRYQLFDSILTTNNLVLGNEYIFAASNYTAMLKDLNAWLAEHQENLQATSKVFAAKEILEKLIETMENFKNDPLNCELQRKVQEEFYNWYDARRAIGCGQIKIIFSKHYQPIPTVVRPYNFEVLSRDIENLLQSMNDTERAEDAKFVEWCQTFLAATENEKRQYIVGSLEEFFFEEFERESKAGNLNCKLLAQIEWQHRGVQLNLHELEDYYARKRITAEEYKAAVGKLSAEIKMYDKLFSQ